MSLKTFIMNLRANRRTAQLQNDAAGTTESTKAKTSMSPLFAIPFALAFVFALCAFIAPPAQATVDINGTIGPILEDIIDLIPEIIDLIVAMVPAVMILALVGFIIAFLDKILGMLKL